MKEEEERLRASMRRESKVKRIKERSTKHGLSSGYLEGGEDDSDEEEGLNALKNRYKQKKGRIFYCNTLRESRNLLERDTTEGF